MHLVSWACIHVFFLDERGHATSPIILDSRSCSIFFSQGGSNFSPSISVPHFGVSIVFFLYEVTCSKIINWLGFPKDQNQYHTDQSDYDPERSFSDSDPKDHKVFSEARMEKYEWQYVVSFFSFYMCEMDIANLKWFLQSFIFSELSVSFVIFLKQTDVVSISKEKTFPIRICIMIITSFCSCRL